MALSYNTITITPGINTEKTMMLNQSGFSSCQLIRFLQGLAQKLGGWSRWISQSVFGVCRGIFAWQDLNSQGYIVCGTNNTLEIITTGMIFDITPQTSTVNLTTPFTTISGTDTMSVAATANGVLAGDAYYMITNASVNGQTLYAGYYGVVSVTDANDFIASTTKTFTASVNGGVTALFTTTSPSPNVQVTLNGHGLVAGNPYYVNVSTTVGGITLIGEYFVLSVIDANNFTFNSGTNASSSTTAHENSGHVRINFLLNGGLVSSTAESGYGIGEYGLGTYGFGSPSSAISFLREWSLGNWGYQLLANPTGGGIYLWDPTSGLTGNPATIISQAPLCNMMFIAMPERQVVALGTNGDPLNIQWSDVQDYTDWTPTVINQAGSYRLPSGSRIVGGIQAPQAALIWTDLGLWLMQYINEPFIYGFTNIASGCGLIGARAMGILGGIVYWMSQGNFYGYTSGSQVIPCPVWDIIFNNINSSQNEKVTCAVNSQFNEIAWYFPSASGTGEVDTYVKYNSMDGVWDYGALTRTAFMDKSVVINAAGVDGNGLIQQHEVSNDADGGPLVSYVETGWFKMADGFIFTFVERIIPDFIMTEGATLSVTIDTVDYPNDTPISQTFSFSSTTEFLVIRQRGRLCRITFSSDDLGSFWRVGAPLFVSAPMGRR